MNSNEKVRKDILHKWLQNPSISYKQLVKQVGTSYYTTRRAVFRFKNSQTIKNKWRIGRPKVPSNKKLEKKVVSIIKKNKSMSIGDIARKAGTLHVMVVKIKKRNSIRKFKK